MKTWERCCGGEVQARVQRHLGPRYPARGTGKLGTAPSCWLPWWEFKITNRKRFEWQCTCHFLRQKRCEMQCHGTFIHVNAKSWIADIVDASSHQNSCMRSNFFSILVCAQKLLAACSPCPEQAIQKVERQMESKCRSRTSTKALSERRQLPRMRKKIKLILCSEVNASRSAYREPSHRWMICTCLALAKWTHALILLFLQNEKWLHHAWGCVDDGRYRMLGDVDIGSWKLTIVRGWRIYTSVPNLEMCTNEMDLVGQEEDEMFGYWGLILTTFGLKRTRDLANCWELARWCLRTQSRSQAARVLPPKYLSNMIGQYLYSRVITKDCCSAA